MNTTKIGRSVPKKRTFLSDAKIRFLSILIIISIYLQIVTNQNIPTGIKGVFLILTTIIPVTFFWDTLSEIAKKWYLKFIGFNTLYFLDAEDKSLKEIVVSRWNACSEALPFGVLAISIPLGGFLNSPCVISERRDFFDLWRVQKQKDVQDTSTQYIQLTDHLGDGISLSMEQALLFLESKQESSEFFPNWMNVFHEMRECISDLKKELDAHKNERHENDTDVLRQEIKKLKKERDEFQKTQKMMFVTIHKSIKTLSVEQPSIASEHITAFINLLIREFILQTPLEEEKKQKDQKNASDPQESTAA